MSRRKVMASAGVVAAGAMAAGSDLELTVQDFNSLVSANGKKYQGQKFKQKYAPHFGMFSKHGKGTWEGELKFAADEGFTGW
jgi:hypothetical protein